MSHDAKASVCIPQAIAMPGLILEAKTANCLKAQTHEVLPEYIKALEESKSAVAFDTIIRGG
jgi:hypothetical protein